MTHPAGLRRSYVRGELSEASVTSTWLELFEIWFEDAVGDVSVSEANAMQIATVDEAGRPSVRTVLLKGVDESGIVFYTNHNSAKGRDLAAQPYASAVFAWLSSERQVRFSGPVTQVSRAETDQYFASRPRGSQIGAWASPQSLVLGSRAELEALAQAAADRFGPDEVIGAPPNWGGYRLSPESVEFWQGRPDRLHDRIRYRLAAKDSWVIERLAP